MVCVCWCMYLCWMHVCQYQGMQVGYIGDVVWVLGGGGLSNRVWMPLTVYLCRLVLGDGFVPVTCADYS